MEVLFEFSLNDFFFSFSFLILSILAIAQAPRPARQQTVDDEEDAELAELKASMAL